MCVETGDALGGGGDKPTRVTYKGIGIPADALSGFRLIIASGASSKT